MPDRSGVRLSADEQRAAAADASAEGVPVREVIGQDMGRIVSLSDGVFAFAMTLLVLSLITPIVTGSTDAQTSRRLLAALQQDWPAFLGYGFAFVMISVWWVAHHRVFRYIERYDERLIWLNLALLLEIAVMPFVLSIYRSYPFAQIAVILFAVAQVAAGFTIAAIWRHATRGRKLVNPQLHDRVIRYIGLRSLVSPAIFLVSIGVSFLSVGGAEITWLFAIVAQRVLGSKYGAA